ncbi:MAG TPA: RNA polymerase sigma-70 factor [Bacteroidetes bacterium]|nr:RNA polymerase sigma-70 factor [Bacteroidota bacterium]
MKKSGLKTYTDQELFDSLFRATYARLHNFARMILGHESVADDMVQSAFMKLWQSKREALHDHPERLLFVIVRNNCLNYIRHQKIIKEKHQDLLRVSQWEDLYRIEFIGNQPYTLIQKEIEHEMEEIVNGLPKRCGEVFKLSRFDGLKQQEIADKLNISVKSVQKHITHALKIFREKYGDQIYYLLILYLLLK